MVQALTPEECYAIRYGWRDTLGRVEHQIDKSDYARDLEDQVHYFKKLAKRYAEEALERATTITALEQRVQWLENALVKKAEELRELEHEFDLMEDAMYDALEQDMGDDW